MAFQKLKVFINNILENMPKDWLFLTTHRLDIYDEQQAKTLFLEKFEILFKSQEFEAARLLELPTAFDYIRLGHPLSCILEWVIAKQNQVNSENVISFSSDITPILAVLRKNLLMNKRTQIVHSGDLPKHFEPKIVQNVYGYQFELCEVDSMDDIPSFNGSTIYIATQENLINIQLNPNIDFLVVKHTEFGSVMLVNGKENNDYISEIQHVRRRESIAMTPDDCHTVLQQFTGHTMDIKRHDISKNKEAVCQSIKEITKADIDPVIGSSGLSIQYAITMGLIHDALENHEGHQIKMIIPPNCYGGTNDQARRVAACLDQVEIVDLPVDGDYDMVQSIDTVLDQLAKEDAIPLIIVEIPTNPRVQVPNLEQLKEVLQKSRKANSGKTAIDPIFILDQTFCPNVHFIGDADILSSVRTISYVSGSKFPSGGLCTAGYCLSNKKAAYLMEKIDLHLKLCDNTATNLQIELLAKQLPSMNKRIKDAYVNTLEFVNFITDHLPEAKINFVTHELAERGFTPSVFSLDLPTKGNSHQDREAYKRALNDKLISMMISNIDESKYCVSYGQLKGCYWTIPATSTQGTTKDKDKDYIVRVSCSPDMNLKRHKEVFLEFVKEIQSNI